MSQRRERFYSLFSFGLRFEFSLWRFTSNYFYNKYLELSSYYYKKVPFFIFFELLFLNYSIKRREQRK